MALNVVMMGAPGAGKGTQAEHFAHERGIPKISTGDILREAVQAGTPHGLRLKAVMDTGELIGDDLIIDIATERLARPDALKGFVLDGFPRTLAQARALDEILVGRGPLVVVDIVVPDHEVMRRLGVRRICADCGATPDAFDGSPSSSAGVGRPDPQADACRRCGGRLVQRSDDNEEVVRERLKVYARDTRPIVEYYSGRPTFRTVNGVQAPDRVARDLAEAIESAAVVESAGAVRHPVEHPL